MDGNVHPSPVWGFSQLFPDPAVYGAAWSNITQLCHTIVTCKQRQPKPGQWGRCSREGSRKMMVTDWSTQLEPVCPLMALTAAEFKCSVKTFLATHFHLKIEYPSYIFFSLLHQVFTSPCTPRLSFCLKWTKLLSDFSTLHWLFHSELLLFIAAQCLHDEKHIPWFSVQYLLTDMTVH